MTIDKSLRQGYQWGGPGGKSPGTSATGGLRGESGREQGIREAAQRAAKSTKTSPSGTRDRPTSFLGPEDKKQKEATVEDDGRSKALQEIATRKKGITQTGGDASDMEKFYSKDEEFTDDELEKGITKDGRTIEYIGDKPVTNKSAKEFNLGLKERNIKTGKIQQGRNIIDPFTQQIQSRLAPIDKPKKGLWGTLGNVALGILAPQLLGPKLGQLYSGYNQLRNISKLASTFTGKDIVSDLTSKSNIRNLLSRKTTPTDTRADDKFIGDRGDGRSQALQKIAVQQAIGKGEGLESGKKLLGLTDEETNYFNKLFASRDRKFLQNIFDKGTTRIQSGKATQKEKDVYTLLQQYLVDPKEGIMGVA